MKKFYGWIVDHRKTVLVVFILAAIVCSVLKNFINVDYNLMDYLPQSAESTVALDAMEKEFGSEITNARVMTSQVTIPEAIVIKNKIKSVDGVLDITWLDDSIDVQTPVRMMDSQMLDTYYKENHALFSVTVDENKDVKAIQDIHTIIGDGGAITGSAVDNVTGKLTTGEEVKNIVMIIVPFCILILALVSSSWLEPLLFLLAIGFAIILNVGTNLIFGEISFITNTAGSVLQLAISLDYSLFLLHRFEECRKTIPNSRDAMLEALCKATPSILSSGLTTVAGFAALLAMKYRIGADMGQVLAKGIGFSLFSVLVLLPVLTLMLIKLVDKTSHSSIVPSMDRLGKIVLKIRIPILILFMLMVVPVFLAQMNNNFNYGSSKLFSEETDVGVQRDAIQNIFGESNTMVLMVPKGNIYYEKDLSRDINQLPHITSVISYVDNVGAEIPPEYLDEDTKSIFLSPNYSRLIINASIEAEGGDVFSLVEDIRNTAEKYYGDKYQLAGDSVSTLDLKNVVNEDQMWVNLISIGAIFIILMLTMRSLIMPIILLLVIETSVWLNLSVPYFINDNVFFIAYLIVSSIQLGATVDYAILMSSRYKESRQEMDKKSAVIFTVGRTGISIITPAIILTVAGFLIGMFCTNGTISQLGILLGRGALMSCVMVLIVLPCMLYQFDGLITRKKRKVARQ